MTKSQTFDGRSLIAAEMARQHQDALRSYHANANRAVEVAASITRTGRLTLLGMGGSHWLNRTVLPLYRDLGVDVDAEVLSEALITPLSSHRRTVIITSQSGGSGEIAHYLSQPAPHEERFGVTLNADSVLGLGVANLVGVGGPENAFAATRSILMCQAMHGAILAALGLDTAEALATLATPPSADITAAIRHLSSAKVIALTGRSTLQGVAENGALCLLELSRLPAFAFEGGQLRHGPMEMLSADMGAIVLRPAGVGSDLSARLAADLAAICPTVVLDLSGEPSAAGALTVTLPQLSGLAAAHAALPVLQELLVEIAATRVEDLGQPIRSTKITTTL